MSVRLLREFQKMAELHHARGPYLEVGPRPKGAAVLAGDYFSGAERHAVGAGESPQLDGIEFHRCNPNDMRSLFDDGCFSTVISNAALVHDKRFWLSLDEMKRVLAPEGMLIIAVPGFSKVADQSDLKVIGPKGNQIMDATPTPRIHAPPDYWRFSPQAMRQVVLEGLDIKSIRVVMMPPLVMGVGVRPG